MSTSLRDAETNDEAKPTGPDARIAAKATEQHGVITRTQLLSIGLTDRQITARVRRGLLHPVSQSVYAVGHNALGRRGRTNAALLQLGPGTAAVSHESAARAWGLMRPLREGDIHVSVVDRRDLAVPKGIVLHRPRQLSEDDINERHGLPVTSPERTIRDLLPTSTVEEITRLLEQMVTWLQRSPDDLHDWGKGLSRTRGKGRLMLALDHVVGPAVLRSELELQFRNLCQTQGIPMPQTNVRLGRWEADVLFKAANLVVELDSYRYHGGRWQFDRDRKKALELAGMGYEVIRLTWFQVKHEGEFVAQTLRKVLDRRLVTA